MLNTLIISTKYVGYSPDICVIGVERSHSKEPIGENITSASSETEQTTAKFCFSLNPVQASCFRSELLRSRLYMNHVYRNLARNFLKEPDVIIVKITLMPIRTYPIDYRFGKEIQILVNEAIELDHFMSTLSTLGGAFSSLGDQFIDFAKIAGKISVQQYKIALKLGDPFNKMRCQLYFSISLIQCLKLKAAKHIIQHVYQAMKLYPKDKQDQRILFMCLGIWAKLKYVWQTNKRVIN